MMPTFVHWPGFLGFAFTILTLLLLAATVPVAVVLTRRNQPAEEALRIRYGKGEIDVTELK